MVPPLVTEEIAAGPIFLSFFFLFFFSSFSPFSSQTHKKKKKKSTIGATNWLLSVCEFFGCFKDANEFYGFVLQA